jgi:hypothetical protein
MPCALFQGERPGWLDQVTRRQADWRFKLNGGKVMWLRLAFLASLASGAASPLAVAQPVQQYSVPHTAHGHPDIQGVWKTEFLTMLERPEGIGDLVVSG